MSNYLYLVAVFNETFFEIQKKRTRLNNTKRNYLNHLARDFRFKVFVIITSQE